MSTFFPLFQPSMLCLAVRPGKKQRSNALVLGDSIGFITVLGLDI